MSDFKKTFQHPFSGTRGFTVIELVIVIAMMSIMASIAVVNYNAFKRKAYDTAALSDTRNLVDAVINAALSGEDIDYTKVDTGGPVGDLDTGAAARSPIFILSPGVAARINGNTRSLPDGMTTLFQATVYHTNGTPDAASPSGRKEYSCLVDEAANTVSLP